MTDIVVVGGGPAGSLTSSALAAAGRDVVMLEEHEAVGLPAHCTGVVSDAFMRSIPVSPEVLSTIRGARVVFPGGRTLELERGNPFGYMIDRRDLDGKLCDRARGFGVDVRLGTSFSGARFESSRVTALTNRGEIRADVLVGADGQGSAVAAAIGSGISKEYVIGAQADVPCRADDPGTMTLWLGNNVAPGFFAWKIPREDGFVRYGLCVSPGGSPPSVYLNSLMTSDGVDVGAPGIERFGGKIPLGSRSTIYGDRTLLIGDAASQVKPVSGGGLMPILEAVPLLADAVHEAYDMNLFTSAVFGQYEVEWKRKFGSVRSRGMKMRHLYCSLNDSDRDRVGEAFDDPEVIRILSEIDIDDPSQVIRPILGVPGVKSKLLFLLRAALSCIL